MKYLLFSFCMFSSVIASAQNANSIWVFGDSAGIDFRNISNPVPISSGMVGRGSCASISDSAGNLSLYAFTHRDGGWTTYIYNSEDTFVSGVSHITGDEWYNEVVITDKPSSHNQFYVFTLGLGYPFNNGFYYTLIDMDSNAGAGQVLQQNIQLDSVNRGDCMQAVKHANGRDWWVITKLYDSVNDTYFNRFYVYLVTPDSIYSPIIQDLGGAIDGGFQKQIFKQSGDSFMLINRAGYMGEYLFDRCNGSIALLRTIFPEQTNNYTRYFWEGAYSPDGNLFYVSTVGASTSDSDYLVQFDLTAANVPASADTLDVTISPIGQGAVRLAPDGKIYFSCAYESPSVFSYPYADSMRNYINENLSVINNPDIVGGGCDYQPLRLPTV